MGTLRRDPALAAAVEDLVRHALARAAHHWIRCDWRRAERWARLAWRVSFDTRRV